MKKKEDLAIAKLQSSLQQTIELYDQSRFYNGSRSPSKKAEHRSKSAEPSKSRRQKRKGSIEGVRNLNRSQSSLNGSGGVGFRLSFYLNTRKEGEDFSSLMHKYHRLAMEVKLPAIDKRFYDQQFAQNSSTANLSKLNVLVSVLQEHKERTIEVLAAIREREALMVKWRALNEQYIQGFKSTSETRALVLQLATGLQTTGLRVVESIVRWRATLTRPFPFRFREKNYLITMLADCQYIDECKISFALPELKVVDEPLLSSMLKSSGTKGTLTYPLKPSKLSKSPTNSKDASPTDFVHRVVTAEETILFEYDLQEQLREHIYSIKNKGLFLPVLNTPDIASANGVVRIHTTTDSSRDDQYVYEGDFGQLQQQQQHYFHQQGSVPSQQESSAGSIRSSSSDAPENESDFYENKRGAHDYDYTDEYSAYAQYQRQKQQHVLDLRQVRQHEQHDYEEGHDSEEGREESRTRSHARPSSASGYRRRHRTQQQNEADDTKDSQYKAQIVEEGSSSSSYQKLDEQEEWDRDERQTLSGQEEHQQNGENQEPSFVAHEQQQEQQQCDPQEQEEEKEDGQYEQDEFVDQKKESRPQHDDEDLPSPIPSTH